MSIKPPIGYYCLIEDLATGQRATMLSPNYYPPHYAVRGRVVALDEESVWVEIYSWFNYEESTGNVRPFPRPKDADANNDYGHSWAGWEFFLNRYEWLIATRKQDYRSFEDRKTDKMPPLPHWTSARTEESVDEHLARVAAAEAKAKAESETDKEPS